MLFMYNFGLNGEANKWQYVEMVVWEAFGQTEWPGQHGGEICVFGRWIRFELVCPD